VRSILITVLLSGVVLLIASSCATAPKESLASGEVRLLSMDVLGSGIEANASFAVNIFLGSHLFVIGSYTNFLKDAFFC
jgi:hypothetical protein